jgi:8-amino-7-oxononanoate synthase
MKDEAQLRSVRPMGQGIDFCSNDYLGLARELGKPGVLAEALENVEGRIGATGSRLLSGTTEAHTTLEAYLAKIFGAQSALLFGSGYEANVGLLACIAKRGDTIIYDQQIHASMRDGIRLSSARTFSFKHNDIEDLRKKITQATGEVFVAVESLYSMDGDRAPLIELCQLAQEYGVFLIVDEAHATGVYGESGEGLVGASALSNQVFARVHTFGKAIGYKGACIVGSQVLTDYLINFCRPFIYSTAPDTLTVALTMKALRLSMKAHDRRELLMKNISHWCNEVLSLGGWYQPLSPIQYIPVPGNRAVVQVQQVLEKAGIEAKAVRSPTVQRGKERIRICLHCYNTLGELKLLRDVLNQSFKEYVSN